MASSEGSIRSIVVAVGLAGWLMCGAAMYGGLIDTHFLDYRSLLGVASGGIAFVVGSSAILVDMRVKALLDEVRGLEAVGDDHK